MSKSNYLTRALFSSGPQGHRPGALRFCIGLYICNKGDYITYSLRDSRSRLVIFFTLAWG